MSRIQELRIIPGEFTASNSDTALISYGEWTYAQKNDRLAQSSVSVRERQGQLPPTDRASAFVSRKLLARAGGVVDRVKIVPFDHQAKFGYSFSYLVRAYRGSQKSFDTLVLRPLRIGGVPGPQKHARPPQVLSRQIWLFQVKRLAGAYCVITEILREKFDPSRPAFQATQGHWNRHGSTGHLSELQDSSPGLGLKSDSSPIS